MEIIESISPEDLQPMVKICIDGLQSQLVAVKHSTTAKLRLLAKNCADNWILIAKSGAVPVLVPLHRCISNKERSGDVARGETNWGTNPHIGMKAAMTWPADGASGLIAEARCSVGGDEIREDGRSVEVEAKWALAAVPEGLS
ncbi:hypothetical protein LR48_Vigan03g083200 [Vigna angularis]|uniref:Uncharacterized protein n=1 Tax=Phaseolus angularis TaxID=3914 RepID=A0A0L9U3U7_PHAAN|nr:hypothetical protein LR48_Vigan03g083200 [Vigna angularis]